MKIVAALFLIVFTAAPTLSANAFDQDPAHVTSLSQVEDLDSGLGAADQEEPRELIEIGWGLIKDFEGWVDHAYNDAAMFCTIGYGHLIAKAPCETLGLAGEFAGNISLPRGLEILKIDSTSARNAVDELVTVTLDDGQFAALSSFVFNVGKTNFAKSTLLKRVNSLDHKAAAGQFALWVKAGGKVFQGLVTRRGCEAALYAGKLKAAKDGSFSRSLCETLGAAPDDEDLIDLNVGE